MMIDLLSAADVFRTTGSVLLAILILLVMITVHEFGHYVAGKLLKFKIDEFSIGFGPAFFKKKRKKSGETFALRLVPLGGYCAFSGEDGEEEEHPFFKEKTPAEEGAEKPPAPPAVPKKRNELWTDDGKFTHMKPWKRLVVLCSGAAMNYLLALILITVCLLAYGQSMPAVYETEKENVPPEYAQYSLQDKDILLEADGRDLYLTTDLARAVDGKKRGDMVEFVLTRLAEDGTREKMTVSVMLREDVNVKSSTDTDAVWAALGVKTPASGTQRFGFFETLGRSFVYSWKIAGSIFRVIGELFTGRLGLSAVGGPLTTISLTSQVARRSFRNFLEIAGFIGVNLAVFNLLPIPALDGSKMVFTAIEWVRGRPISRKVEAIVHAVGFVFLIGFAILVDVLQFI